MAAIPPWHHGDVPPRPSRPPSSPSITVPSVRDDPAAGASGFGSGSALYNPGRSAEQVGAITRTFVQAGAGTLQA